MARRFPNSDSLTSLTNVVMGVGIAAASAAAGLALPTGTAQFAFGLGGLIGQAKDRQQRQLVTVFTKLRKQVEQDWEAWAGLSSDIDPAMVRAAVDGFDAVMPLIEISTQDIVARQLDPERLADLALEKAEAALPEIYGQAQAEGALARRFLHDLAANAYRYLREDLAFTEGLAPDLWATTLTQMSQIEEAVSSQRSHQDSRFDRIETLLHDALKDGAAGPARDSGVSEAALIALASRIAKDVRDGAQALRELENAVEIAIQVQDQGRGGDPVFHDIALASARGDHSAALATVEGEIARMDSAHNSRKLSLLEAAIEQDLLQRDVRSATGRVIEITDIAQGGKADFAALRAAAIDWFTAGRDTGLLIKLDVAAALAKSLMLRAGSTLDRGAALNVLGVIEHTIGERSPGMERLNAASAAFEEALFFWSKDSEPDLWAKAQMNLANTTLAMAQRDLGNARLERAIQAYDTALEIRSRESDPSSWAMTQMNLGMALRILGDERRDPSAYEKSLAAIEAALSERTREKGEVPWAITVLNRAMTKRAKGELTGDRALIAEALPDLVAAAEALNQHGAAYYLGHCAMSRGMTYAALAVLDPEDAQHMPRARAAYADAVLRFGAEVSTLDQMMAQGYEALAQMQDALAQQDDVGLRRGQRRLDLALIELEEAGHSRGVSQLRTRTDMLQSVEPPLLQAQE